MVLPLMSGVKELLNRVSTQPRKRLNNFIFRILTLILHVYKYNKGSPGFWCS